MHEDQKNIHADGKKLIDQFVRPLKLVSVMRPSERKKI
jgi:hypothetical protein